MEDDTDMLLAGLKDWKLHNKLQPLNLNLHSSLTHNSYPKQWSMVVIKDDSSSAGTGDDFTVFPPSKHENLTPSDCNSESKYQSQPSPSSPVSPFSFLRSDFDRSSPPAAVSLFPKWWGFAIQIWRSRITYICSYFRCKGGDKKSFWSFGNIALAAAVVLWWLSVRIRRRSRRRNSVYQLMQIISERDKKIMQLLIQIAEMNQVLLNRHKVMASKLAN